MNQTASSVLLGKNPMDYFWSLFDKFLKINRLEALFLNLAGIRFE
jgi:hypothetical protein